MKFQILPELFRWSRRNSQQRLAAGVRKTETIPDIKEMD